MELPSHRGPIQPQFQEPHCETKMSFVQAAFTMIVLETAGIILILLTIFPPIYFYAGNYAYTLTFYGYTTGIIIAWYQNRYLNNIICWKFSLHSLLVKCISIAAYAIAYLFPMLDSSNGGADISGKLINSMLLFSTCGFIYGFLHSFILVVVNHDKNSLATNSSPVSKWDHGTFNIVAIISLPILLMNVEYMRLTKIGGFYALISAILLFFALYLGRYVGRIVFLRAAGIIAGTVHVIKYLKTAFPFVVFFIGGYTIIACIFASIYSFIWKLDGNTFLIDTLSQPNGSAVGFLDFIYFSFTTISTVGYGDIKPIAPISRLATILEIITGFAWATVIFASATATLINNKADSAIAALSENSPSELHDEDSVR